MNIFIIGVTGGIATGKTTFARMLSERLGTEYFSADECSGALLAGDSEVAEEIKARVCSDAYRADGTPDRARLRAVVFSDPVARRELEAILHPRVRAAFWECVRLAAASSSDGKRDIRDKKDESVAKSFMSFVSLVSLEAGASSLSKAAHTPCDSVCRTHSKFFVSEIPLLFEAGLESDFHSVVCVACSEEVRLTRLTARPGISSDDAKKMIASQLPLNDKIEKSRCVVWNDGTLDALAAQAEVLANQFSSLLHV